LSNETDTKVERVARIARDAGRDGVLLTTQRNFAWLTGGASSRIDGSREPGAGALLISAKGRRFVVANTIEMPRLQAEALSGLGFAPVEYPWTEDHANPAAALGYARAAISASALAADWPFDAAQGKPVDAAHNTLVVEPALMRARVDLVDEEIVRYRELGRDMGRTIGDFCRSLRPGDSERAIANAASAAIYRSNARPIVILVAADDRIARFRHPVATGAEWRTTVMVVVCAERHGLVVALSRIVSVGAVDARLRDRTVAAARVFGRLLERTREGTTGTELFGAAARAYEEAGFAGQELNHHQGGAIGYRSREWLAHPRSEERVLRQQAFAWNPSITGSKIEDTVLLVNGEIEVITGSPQWPTIEAGAVAAHGVCVR
jgi:antitoxin VapB